MNLNTRQGAGTVSRPGYKRNIAREGFIYRGATIFNKLDESLRKEPKLQKFKDCAKEWVKSHISIRPKQLFQSIAAVTQTNQPPPPPQTRNNLITRYFRSQPKL